MSRILDEVTRTSIALLLQEPFYAHFFSSLNKEVVAPDSKRVPTMAVGLREKTVRLFINPTFWDTQLTNPQHRYGVVKHEVLHLLFKHLTIRDAGLDRRLLNIAADLVVNQYIARTQLPEESLFLETFSELNLLPDQTWRYYYDQLVDLRKNCTGNDRYAGSRAAANLAQIENTSHGLDRHGPWQETVRDLSDLECQVIEAQLEGLVRIGRDRTPLKAYTLLPAGLRLHLDALLLKPKALVDWRRVLRLFAESSDRTVVRATLKRPSRRFGTVPGHKVKPRQRLLLVLDTSGSIGADEYGDFFTEIHHLWRRGADLEIMECDAAIQRTYAYTGRQPTQALGGGGTDFNEPLAYANLHRPDGLIYFTDGHAERPRVRPRYPVLWVISRSGLTPDQEAFAALPGRKAKLV